MNRFYEYILASLSPQEISFLARLGLSRSLPFLLVAAALACDESVRTGWTRVCEPGWNLGISARGEQCSDCNRIGTKTVPGLLV